MEKVQVAPQSPAEKVPTNQFDGKLLVKDTLVLNSIIFAIIISQYIAYPIIAGLLLHDFTFLTVIFLGYIICALIGAKYYRNIGVSLLNSVLLLIGFAGFGYMAIFFNGPFNIPLFCIICPMALLNMVVFFINVRGQWRGGLGNLIIAGLFYAMCLVMGILVHNSLLDWIALLFPTILFGFALEPILKKVIGEWKKNKSVKVLLKREKIFNLTFYHSFNRVKNHNTVLIGVLFIGLCIGGLLLGTFFNWGATITIKAPEGTKTISSYWGPPSLTLKSGQSNISVSDLNRLQIDNSTLVNPPEKFIPGSLAYVTAISVNGTTGAYCNYSAGARSYPNGTVFLSTPLSSPINVTVTFQYVFNNIVLQYLNISRSTCVMNFHGDFIYHSNIFDRITTVYLLQLLDYWEIKYYLDIHNGVDFPHVFNYLDSIPLGYQTLDWAHGKWTMFQGISYDFEPGAMQRGGQHPGTPNYEIGNLIGNESDFAYQMQKSWYSLNEQNHTFFKNVTAEYEDLFTYASKLGYKTYITLGLTDMLENIDGDIDVTRCPTDPLSRNPDVLYGHMLYQDNNFISGRYRVYQGCTDQIRLLGDQGKTILLGWIAKGTRYYTDDEEGFQRYIADCKIAQAAGMEEILHAPIYRMQGKWGDDAILRLHQALNEDPIEPIIIPVPAGTIHQSFLEDVIKNLNRLWLAIPLIILIPGRLIFFETGQVWQRIKKKKKNLLSNNKEE